MPEHYGSAKEIKAGAEAPRAATPAIRKMYEKGTQPDPLRGRFEATPGGKHTVVEYEPDPDLRDTEQVLLIEDGGPENDGIGAFLRRDVRNTSISPGVDRGRSCHDTP